jgi:penicillin-binding protein 2B
MKKKKVNLNRVKTNKLIIIFVLILFCLFIVRICYLCLVDYRVGTTTITAFIKNRNMETDIILPNRGTIYDSSGNILAEDVASYTIIAYLDPSRSEGATTQQHVSDIDMTAETLAPYLDMDVDELKGYLSKDAYQVELGSKGRNLTQIQKEEIESLGLPGIGFEKSTKRYYPNGNFASYLLGYTVNKTDDDGNIWKVGEMGLEAYFNDTLTGTSGSVTYERDRYGYTIANGREYVEEANDGDDIYLTIDSNIQLFVENALEEVSEESEAELALMTIVDAKTGAILAYSSTPSFDPNTKDIVSYIDPIVGYAYEPGSVMKIFSYMCDIENGLYNGNATYKSGNMTYTGVDGSKTVINDWKKVGWGDITYDKGFALSSNIAVANLVQNGLTKKILKSCYDDYGFGETTGLPLYGEVSGNTKFNYEIEVATAGFGQGITTTAMQLMQALTAITNDGVMLKPYIVSKIVDSDTDEVTYEGQREEIREIASTETIEKIQELMSSVVCNVQAECTGSSYYMEDYPLMAKTGTAQIWDDTTNSYMSGSSDYIYSFAGIYPSDDPEVIIYMAVKRPKDETNYIAPVIKDIIVNISKYLNINTQAVESKSYTLSTYLNKSITSVTSELEKNNLKVITLGTSGKVVKQYPSKGNVVYSGDTVILVSSDYDNTMLDLTGLSYKEAVKVLNLMSINYEIEGTGYVYSQSISKGTKFTSSDLVTIKLKEKYSSEDKTE